MTARDPLWMMNGATPLVDAEEARLGNAAHWVNGSTAIKVTSGVVPATGTPLRVHQTGTASANLLVESGQAVIQGTSSATQGAYTATLDAQLTLSYLGTYPADAQPRKDIIVARINDAAYAGATASFTIEVVKGTASGSPVDPTLPASCLALARINLPASASTVADAVIDDLRVFTTAVGGLIPCTSSSRPAFPYTGMHVYETDTGRQVIYDGSAWVTAKRTIPAVTATLTTNSGSTSGTGEITPLTSPAITGDGVTKVKVTASFFGIAGQTVGGDTFEVRIKRGATQLQSIRVKTSGTSTEGGCTLMVVDTPPAGSVTYTVAMARVLGTGTAQLGAGATAPATITVEQFS